MHEKNSYVTLTYDDDSLPQNESLDNRDFQLFMKRLRKSYCVPDAMGTVPPVRFFQCGEYGAKTFRPHHHAILFGIDFDFDRVLHQVQRGHRLYRSEYLESKWQKGHCLIGDVTFQSAAYVARYCIKTSSAEQLDKMCDRVDENGEVFQVKRPYITMSRRPGIGSEWFQKFGEDVFPSDEVIHNGRRFRTPRFYDEKLDDQVLEQVKAKRREKLKFVEEHCTADRLLVRERLANRRSELLKREL